MSDEIDLAGAHPAHWPEARRRIGIIDQFLAIAAPTETDVERAASQLSISSSHFRRLVRAWTQHRDAGRIPGIRPAQVPQRQTHNRLPAATTRIVEDVIEEMPGLPAAAILEHVSDRCAAAATPAPRIGTIYAALARRRSSLSARTELPSDMKLVVACCWIGLPFEVEGHVVRPRLSMAFLQPGGQIVGHKWSIGDDRLSAMSKAFEASDETISQPTPLRLHLPDELSAWKAAKQAGAAGCVIEEAVFGSTGASLIAAMTGNRLGGLPVTLRAWRKFRPLLRDRRDTPLSPEDMTVAIDQAITKHNDRRPSTPPFRLCNAGARGVLLDRLAASR